MQTLLRKINLHWYKCSCICFSNPSFSMLINWTKIFFKCCFF